MDEATRGLVELRLSLTRATEMTEHFSQWERWKTKLMFYDIEPHPAVKEVITSLESPTRISDSLIGTGGDIPTQLRRDLTTGFDELTGKQEAVRTTRNNTTAILERAHQALTKMESASTSLESRPRPCRGRSCIGSH